MVQRDILEIGVNSAVIEFNDGPSGIYAVLEHFGMRPGSITMRLSDRKTRKRAKNAKRKMSEAGKRRRKKLRSIKNGYLDTEKELEGGESYISGGH